MNKNLKAGGQGGFTLIELIVVIVILGILAATALPKFTGLSADARASSAQAVKGALGASTAMIHGKYLIDPATTAKNGVTVDGTVVNLTNGYPTASTALATAAGLSTDDYAISLDGNGALNVSPKSAATPTSCVVIYTSASSSTTAPTIKATTTDCN